MRVNNIHHLSSIVWHAQENVDFYTGVLGLKLIKKTLNFDDHKVYHFYYGNENSILGSGLTFFPWKNTYKEGMKGDGQVGVQTLMIPEGSLNFWKERLNSFGVKFDIVSRFNSQYLRFNDPHGIALELVETNYGTTNPFEFNGVTKEVAIKGIFGAVIFIEDYLKTKEFFINDLGLEFIEENSSYVRLRVVSDVPYYVDLYKHSMGLSKIGATTVHHIAFGVNESEIENWKTVLEEKGYVIGDIKNREFFKSIYFREPGGTIIELASNTPGFTGLTNDINPELFIPPHYNDKKDEIYNEMMPIFVKPITKLESYPYQNKNEYDIWKDHQDLLKRINELAFIKKNRDLTEEELIERDILRKKYLAHIRGTIKNNLDNISIEDENGNQVSIKKEVN